MRAVVENMTKTYWLWGRLWRNIHNMWQLTWFSGTMEESEIKPKLRILVIGKIKIMVPVIETVNSGEEVLRKKINEFQVAYEEMDKQFVILVLYSEKV